MFCVRENQLQGQLRMKHNKQLMCTNVYKIQFTIFYLSNSLLRKIAKKCKYNLKYWWERNLVSHSQEAAIEKFKTGAINIVHSYPCLSNKRQPANEEYYIKINFRIYRAELDSLIWIKQTGCGDEHWRRIKYIKRPMTLRCRNTKDINVHHTKHVNPLNPQLNPICYLLALLAHHFLHVSRIRAKSLTHRLLISYIYGAPILDVSRSHTTTQHSP